MSDTPKRSPRRNSLVPLYLHVSKPMKKRLVELVRSGLYGTSPESAAERLIARALERLAEATP